MKKGINILFMMSVLLIYGQEKYTIKNLASNTADSEFGVTFYSENEVVYSASLMPIRTIRKPKWRPGNQSYLELYKGKIDANGAIIDRENFSTNINSLYHDSNIAFSNDFKTVYFSSNNAINNKKLKRSTSGWALIHLYKATIDTDGSWTDITEMPFNNDDYQTGHPTLNATGTKLYFISDMPGGFGATDIYEVVINEDGSYGEPKNLGAAVNTSKKEMFPYINAQGVLYFSSNGFENTLGGLDLYAAQSDASESFLEVVQLEAPLNSAGDDFSIVYKDATKGYFSSNREGGNGSDDIYSFKVNKLTKNIIGSVKDKRTGALLPGTAITIYDNDKIVKKVKAGTQGDFELEINKFKNYRLVAENNGYHILEKRITNINEQDLILDLVLDGKVISVPIVEANEKKNEIKKEFFPIYFDIDSYDIREDAEIVLNTIIDVLRESPTLKIEGGSHTDSRGREPYNKWLSSKRAKSTVEYLIKKGGIASDRISVKGFGSSQLRNKCAKGVICSEVLHQENRRTEFVIANPEVIK